MFDQHSIDFLRDLSANNTKAWFDAQKPRYVTHIKEAAAQFCDDLAPRLAAQYKTQVTSKVFRMNRDLRFSKDKTPYNTHVRISVMDATTGAAWMVGLDLGRLTIGYGVFAFDKTGLIQWRDTVAGAAGDALRKDLAACAARGMRLDEPELKRVPAPFEATHPNADLLRRKGIALWRDDLAQEVMFGPDGAAKIAEALSAFTPLRDWMKAELTG